MGTENVNYPLNFDARNSLFNNLNNKVIGRINFYWISQITGWTIFVSLNLFIISTLDAINYKRTILWILLGLLGILFTHLFRKFLKKKNWTNLPLKKIVPRLVISCVVVGLLIYIPVAILSLIVGSTTIEEYKLANLIGGAINIISVTFFWSLIYFALHYFESSKKAEIESLIFEAAVKDYELKTLKSQLNPHFMFNAMNSIRALIEEDPQSAKDAITKLSNLLRYALRIERTETVPLGDELKNIKDYLDLERIRFEERLKYVIKSTPDADRVEVPPMMVQTLVENGIKHGISKSTSGGEISVESKVFNNRLKVLIRNTGRFDENLMKNSNGFGISNTKHRLSLLYGENAFFSIKNENENNVLTELTIPLEVQIK